MRRVLIVAYYFPPAGGIGSLRLSGFARHLPHFGWDPLLLAPRDPSYHHDPCLTVDEGRVIRTGSFELSRMGKRVLRAGGDDSTAAEVTGVRMRIRDTARSALYFPDAQIGWYPPALWAARRAVRERRIDAIFSSSFPITAHLIARRLHRTTHAPWVAEFRDPWSQTLTAGSIRRRRAARLERALMREATTAITVSPSWARLFSQTWGRPVEVLPNGHGNESTPPAREQSSEGELVVGYLGTYYPDIQDLRAVWAALARIHAPSRVRLIGPANATFAEQLAAYGLGDRLEVTGFLSHRTALDELNRCSVLVLAGPTDASGLMRGHVVAKVWEYLATDLPIVYVGDPSGDVAEILRRYTGCAVHSAQDIDGITRSLTAAVGQRHPRDPAATSRSARAGELARVLDAATMGA